jgi:hypothetical protein
MQKQATEAQTLTMMRNHRTEVDRLITRIEAYSDTRTKLHQMSDSDRARARRHPKQRPPPQAA